MVAGETTGLAGDPKKSREHTPGVPICDDSWPARFYILLHAMTFGLTIVITESAMVMQS